MVADASSWSGKKTTTSAFHRFLDDSNTEAPRTSVARNPRKKNSLKQRIRVRGHGNGISPLCQGQENYSFVTPRWLAVVDDGPSLRRIYGKTTRFRLILFFPPQPSLTGTRKSSR